ncbi:rhomboid-like protein [Streptomyces sp. NPDC016845]|uniref:rhomboid-like protein n=1 Tax=Streptomyces sp. NPDC016845 TaxID=3364972 RepID=UPI00379EB518
MKSGAAADDGAAPVAEARPRPALIGVPAQPGPPAAETAPRRPGARRRRLLRLLPTPTGTPFTFTYALILIGTSLFTEFADPDTVARALRASSTDVTHLAQSPVLVLTASALWIVGGVASPFMIAFVVVLTALERRTGGRRTAAVFVLGHVLATLATEIPVGLSVMVGHLPDTSLHRLDYGVSFGLAASIGALAGLLTPWPRYAVLLVFGAMLIGDLLTFADPMTSWGHLLALAVGVATWPLPRRRRNRAPGLPADSSRTARRSATPA